MTRGARTPAAWPVRETEQNTVKRYACAVQEGCTENKHDFFLGCVLILYSIEEDFPCVYHNHSTWNGDVK